MANGRRVALLCGWLVTAGLTGFAACKFDFGPPVTYEGGGGPGGIGNLPSGRGVGEDCSTEDCRPGLECVKDVCQPAGNLPHGSPCVIAAECVDDSQCVAGTCVPAGDGDVGDACTSDASCQAGLRCGIVGLSAVCVPAGTGDLGQSCERHDECFAGLYCAAGACSLPQPPLGVPLWPGAECEPSSDGPVRAYFEVPGAAGGEEGDFFRLPFPNDIRLKGKRPDLTGFPTPGPELLGVDLVKVYVDRLEAQGDRWGANGSVLFRFSGAIDFDSVRFENGKRPVVLVDLTTGDPTERLGVSWSGGSGRTKYVCPNWLSVRASFGSPLRPGHTYAVWITDDVRAADGSPVQRSPHFEAMLDDAEPEDEALAAAHSAYAPLRAYLADQSIPPSSLVNAAVFTVGDALDPMEKLAAAVNGAPVPTASKWVRCGEGVESPCPQAEGSRGCGSGTNDYDEYHALVSLPIFQKGEAPYLESGGDIGDTVVRNEEVCMALTVPKGDMPTDGWPLVIFAHGTGGSFRSHIRPEVAGALATATPQFAVLGIDQVQHGPRRGDSTESPEVLFFNFINPDAARGNPLQGAADQLSLYRFAAALDLTAQESGGEAIRIDATRILFFGHSQGSTHGSLMLPLSQYAGAVLSGNGGSLVHALLTKTNPVNLAGALPLVLQDPTPQGTLAMQDAHPVLSLLQHWIDPAEPLNFARAVAREPLASQTPKHVLQTFGLGDTYSPPKTMAAYALAAELSLAPHPSGVSPSGDDVIPGRTPADAPVSGNVTVDGTSVTAVVRQYALASDSDGHFVVFDVSVANQDVVNFLSAVASGTSPSVP